MGVPAQWVNTCADGFYCGGVSKSVRPAGEGAGLRYAAGRGRTSEDFSSIPASFQAQREPGGLAAAAVG